MEENAGAANKRLKDMREVAPDKAFQTVPEQARILAQRVAYTIEVPFEGSALALQTLANILTGARVKDPDEGSTVPFIRVGGDSVSMQTPVNGAHDDKK